MFGMKVGLRNIRALAGYLGNPQDRFHTVHVAGTNGKGSTSSMLAAILTASGYRTGLYTSPHLIDFRERIRVDGIPIDRRSVDRTVRRMRGEIGRLRATFFEATTALAFQYFADRAVDIAVIETGLGGRLDATNILLPLVSIITNIAKDHTEILGPTLRHIASEKGGIIKPAVPCLTGAEDREAIGVLRRIARQKRAPLLQAGQEVRVDVREMNIEGTTVDAIVRAHRYDGLRLPLAGGHQLQNLKLALLAADLLKLHAGFGRITPASVGKGLRGVRSFSGLRGRFEVLQNSPLIIADVAHNPDGTARLAEGLREFLAGKFVLLFGVMKDKEYGKMIDTLAPLTRMVVAVQPDTSRALAASAVTGEFRRRSVPAINGATVARGMSLARAELREGEALLVSGSHYVVGEVLNFLNEPV